MDFSLYKKVMEGKGGGLGCLKVHCVECSHLVLLLHCAYCGVESGIPFHGWEWLDTGDCKLLRVVVKKVKPCAVEEADCQGLGVEELDCKLLGAEVNEVDCKLCGVEEVDCKMLAVEELDCKLHGVEAEE